jgi:hypothetical protein
MTRRTGTAFALALAACGAAQQTPNDAAEAFVQAAQRGDTAALLPLLDGPARARLTAAAARASDQVGGRRTIAPSALLRVVDVDPTFQLTRVEQLEADAATAKVRVHGAAAERAFDLDLLYEEGAWRVHVPLPAAPALSD